MQQSAKELRIKDIPTNGLGKKFADMLNEITLITGLKTPVEIKKDKDGIEKEDASAFSLMFTKFILSYYGMITLSEVTLAFRLNAIGELPGNNAQGSYSHKIDFYGTVLTLEHLGGVLSRYMQKRANLAKKMIEQGTRNILPEPEPTEEQIEMGDREFANEYFRKYISGEFSSASVEYAYMVYDVLDHQKVINLSVEKKKEYFSEAQKIRDQEISLPPASREEKNNLLNLMDAYMNEAVPVSEQSLVKSYAKRLALLDYFKKLKEEGQTKIFK